MNFKIIIIHRSFLKVLLYEFLITFIDMITTQNYKIMYNNQKIQGNKLFQGIITWQGIVVL